MTRLWSRQWGRKPEHERNEAAARAAVEGGGSGVGSICNPFCSARVRGQCERALGRVPLRKSKFLYSGAQEESFSDRKSREQGAARVVFKWNRRGKKKREEKRNARCSLSDAKTKWPKTLASSAHALCPFMLTYRHPQRGHGERPSEEEAGAAPAGRRGGRPRPGWWTCQPRPSRCRRCRRCRLHRCRRSPSPPWASKPSFFRLLSHPRGQKRNER